MKIGKSEYLDINSTGKGYEFIREDSYLSVLNITEIRFGFPKMGGHFGEGLTRRRKTFRVFIIEPEFQISPEKEILRQYYQEIRGLFLRLSVPGWEKVLQAKGIRDESDRGFVVLMDHRYALPEYRALFPKHWQIDQTIRTDPEFPVTDPYY